MEVGRGNPFIRNQFAAGAAANSKEEKQTADFDTALERAGKTAEQMKNGSAVETEQETDYRQFILEKMEEMRAKIRTGTIQPEIQIGAEAYTQEEWQKLLEKIDAAEDTLREQIEAEIEAAREAAQEEENNSDTRIITRADGAKILVITTPFGEMSVELSGPDESLAYDDISRICDDPEETQNLDKTVDNDASAVL
ncbi:MAG: hypothetical protein K2P48_12480 [Lachnospiraceae bacterium]|nr:hypothetical protein [Lachnospiraceae bacterium]